MFAFLRSLFSSKPTPTSGYPTPGKDAQWTAHCQCCYAHTLHVSRGGMSIGSNQHCYSCGYESPITGMKAKDMKDMILHSRVHWMTYPIFPYHWHLLDDQKKDKILCGRKT